MREITPNTMEAMDEGAVGRAVRDFKQSFGRWIAGNGALQRFSSQLRVAPRPREPGTRPVTRGDNSKHYLFHESSHGALHAVSWGWLRRGICTTCRRRSSGARPPASRRAGSRAQCRRARPGRRPSRRWRTPPPCRPGPSRARERPAACIAGPTRGVCRYGGASRGELPT